MGLWNWITKPTKRKFATLVTQRLQHAGIAGQIAFDEEQFCLRIGDDGGIAYLGNAYRDYCEAPRADRERALSTYVRAMLDTKQEMPESFEDAAHDLLAVVRSRAYYEFAAMRARLDGDKQLDIPYSVIGEHLAIGLVYDLPSSMHSIGQRSLDGWGVTFYQALERGRENLADITRELEVVAADGTYFIRTQDSYGASRLLLDAVIDRCEVQGEHVVAVPNRDTLIITGSEDHAGQTLMAGLVKEGVQETRPLTGIVFTRRLGDWEPWLPDRDAQSYSELKLLELQSLGGDYAEQKQLLDALHEREDRDVFVAGYSAIHGKQSGELFSYSVWSEGVDTLLPQTDHVFLFRPNAAGDDGDMVGKAAWAELLDVCGELLSEQDVYPPRYRVAGFPSDAQLARFPADPN